MGALAAWQVWGPGLERATGYTNAIQWGNLALLLACLAAVPLALYWRQHRWPWRAGMALAVALGFAASLLSQSRGGWLAVAAVFPLWLWLAWRLRPQRFGRVLAALALALAALVLVLSFTPRFKDRVGLAATEISGYVHEGQENTSLGLRLAQYQLVARMIPQKPWLGWGTGAYHGEFCRIATTPEWCAAGSFHPHNQFLFFMIEHGLPGLVAFAGVFVSALWQARGMERLDRAVAIAFVGVAGVGSLTHSGIWLANEGLAYCFGLVLVLTAPRLPSPQSTDAARG